MGENDQLPPEPDFAGENGVSLPRHWPIRIVHVLIAIWLALVLAGKAANAQAVRFDQTASTVSAQCAPGKQCPISSLPGTTVNFCSGQNAGVVNTVGTAVTWVSGQVFSVSWTGQISINGVSFQIRTVNSTTSITLASSAGTLTSVTYSSLSACLASPATTYTDFSGVTPCSTTAQLTPQTGGACLSTADLEGDFGAWLLPGQYSYYLRVPATAGGGTYGPYPINVGASAGCPLGVTCDQIYQTLAAACTAAGTGTLYLTRTWSGLTTQTLACNIYALANGIIAPAANQTVTISGTFDGTITQHFSLTQSGSAVRFTGSTDSLTAQWFGVVSGSADTSTNISRAMVTAAASGKALYFPTGNYALCSVVPWASGSPGSGNVTLYGDGMNNTKFIRSTSVCPNFGGTVLLQLNTTGNVNIHDTSWDNILTGTVSFGGAIISVGNSGTSPPVLPASVRFENNYVAHSPGTGFNCQPCQNVISRGNTFDHNVWQGQSFASAGTTQEYFDDPEGTTMYNFAISNNTYISTPYGLELNFFISNITQTGDVFYNSTVGATQIPKANAVFSGNTFSGTPDFGCVVMGTYYDAGCGALTSVYAPYFMEGVGYAEFVGNIISDTVMAGGILDGGSSLTIPLVTGLTLELPGNHVSVHDNHLANVSGINIGIGGAANVGSLTAGSYNAIKGNFVTNVKGGAPAISIAGTAWEIEGNVIETTQTFGYVVSVQNTNLSATLDKGGSFRNNRGHNIGTALGGNYPGLQISGTGTQNIDVFNNEMIDDPSLYSMSFCYQDASSLATGNGSQIRSWGNKCTNGTYWNPARAVPSAGTWKVGQIIENPVPAATGDPAGWINVSAGTPGTWRQLGQLSGLPADKISNRFGPTTPTYTMPLCGVIGINMYSLDCSVWRFGAGSASQFGAIMAYDYTGNSWSFYSSAAVGNADAVTNLSRIPGGGVIVSASDPGCTVAANIGLIWMDTSTTTTARATCQRAAGVYGWVTF